MARWSVQTMAAALALAMLGTAGWAAWETYDAPLLAVWDSPCLDVWPTDEDAPGAEPSVWPMEQPSPCEDVVVVG